MVATYSIGPEDSVQGFGSNVRRRGSNTTAATPTSKPSPNGGLAGRRQGFDRKLTAAPSGDAPIGLLARRSTLNSPRRKLPWLDGKPPSTNHVDKKISRLPGGFVSESDTSSPEQNDNQASYSPKLVSAEQRRPWLTFKPSDKSVPTTYNTYTPSVYSTGAPSAPNSRTAPNEPTGKSYHETLGGSPFEDISYEIQNDRKGSAPMGVSDNNQRLSSAVPSQKQQPIVIEPLQIPSTPQPPLSRQLSPKTALRETSRSPPISNPIEANLRSAIDGLENLMQEAMDMARDATERHEPEDVPQVLENAARGIRRASTMMTRMDPLSVSESSSSSSSTETSYSPRETPTVLTGDRRPSNFKFHRNRTFSAQPVVTDFAYTTKRRKPSSSSSSSGAMSDIEKGRQGSSQWRKQQGSPVRPVHIEDPRPIDPEVHAVHVPPTRQEVHNHISREGTPPYSPRDSSLRHRHQPQATISPRYNRQSRRSEQSTERHHRRHHRHKSGGDVSFHPDYPFNERDTDPVFGNMSLKHPRRHHVSFRGPGSFDVVHHRRRQPIARNWGRLKKRITATIACINTALVGFLVGVYAGEVPLIQYMVADQGHTVILGNVVLYMALAVSTFICWPLPLLHGRKPYILGSLAILLPLQFPQAVVVSAYRDPDTDLYRIGLLLPRAFSGLVLGLANVNAISTLLDLFGASLQSAVPHQELVAIDDVRRHGGGMGLWLGIWSWCFIGSIAVGFMIGACIISSLNASWGFYIVVIMIASVLVLNVIAPETRRARYRQSVVDVVDPNNNVYQRVARGEIKLHISTDGPKWWLEEVFAGMKLSCRMFFQTGFMILSVYLAWMYGQFVLVIVLLGALLSRQYRWSSNYVGAGVISLAIGAFLAIPLTKAGIFSRERKQGARTDSMTFQKQVSWTSHMVRRIFFTAALPFAGLAYTLASEANVHAMVPIAFAGVVGFLSALALAECHGLIMEAFDTCDLQPGANTRHRLQSMAEADRRRRTNYSSFPRVSAGFFVAQTLAFLLAAAATGVGGVMTRTLGAQTSTAVTAGVLLLLTVLLTLALWRFKGVQVIPDHTLGTMYDEKAWAQEMRERERRPSDWRPVVIGHPSGKIRRMNVLEMGRWSRWSEIRRLNRLQHD